LQAKKIGREGQRYILARMSDVARIQSWFDQSKLLKPRASGMNTTVDLINTLAAVCGGRTARAERLAVEIPPAEHYVFIIVDGMGSELLHEHCPSGFLARHTICDLEAVFLSTTGAAMTSYATGRYPAEHGVLGWWIYLEERDLVGISLMFVERFSEKDLRDCGVAPREMFGETAPILASFGRDVAMVTPFPNSVYTDYSSGGCRQIGYSTIDEAFARTLERVTAARSKSFTQVYLPQLDGMCHEIGVSDPRVTQLVRELDGQIERLSAALAGKARIIVSADHGHVALPPERCITLRHDDRIIGLLKCPPCGEPTVPMFHVRSGREEEFAAEFRGRFGEQFALLTADEVDDLRLLGPEPMSGFARRRLGQFMGIAPEPTYLHYEYQAQRRQPFLGTHAGLTRGEMVVPLVVV
jgi:hypothetical protein